MNRALRRLTTVAALAVCPSAVAARADDRPQATATAKPQVDAEMKVATEKQQAPQKEAEAKKEKPTKTAPPADLKSEEKKMVKAAAAAKLAQDAAVQNDAMVQQWLQQFRPILSAELAFIRQICDLAQAQRPKIKAAGEAGLLDAAKKFAQFQQRGQVRAGAGIVPKSQPEPRTIIRAALAQALKETLTSEQMARYSEEAAARAAQHKRAAILSVVSRLDGMLSLTAEQREEISSTLSANWQDKWESWLMMHQYGDQYFPVVPDQFVVVAQLNDEQKSVWRGLQKIEFNFYGGQVAEQPDDTEWWGGEPAKPEVPEALKALGRFLKGNQ